MLPNCYTITIRVTAEGFSCCPVRWFAFLVFFPVHGIILQVAPSSPPDLDETIQPSIELLAPDWHLDGVERVLHDVVCIQFVYLLHHRIHIRLLGLSEEQELDAGLRLETLYAEVRAL